MGALPGSPLAQLRGVVRDGRGAIVAGVLPRIGWLWAVLLFSLIGLGGALPLILAAATGWLVESARTLPPGDASSLTAPLLLVGATFLATQAHTAWLEACGYVLGRRLHHTLGLDVMRTAMRPAGIAHLEDPRIADELDRSRELGQGWSVAEAPYALGVVGCQYVRALLSFAVLAVLSLPSAIAGLVGWLAVGRFRDGTMRLFMRRLEGQAQGLRRAKYLRQLVIGGGAAKESRVFGLGGFLAGKHRESWHGGMAGIFEERRRHDRLALPLVSLFAAGVGGALWLIADAGLEGRLGLPAVIVAIQALAGLAGIKPSGDEAWQLQIGAKLIRNARDADRVASHPSAALTGTRSDVALRDRLRLEQVRFAYPGSPRAILDGLDLEIPAGGSLAIVGENGAGKTTLIKLLARLYDPAAGRITVDGIDLRELDPRAWQRSIGVIFQDFVRFELSARENIAFGAPHLEDPAALERAARLAGIADAIDGIGWETTLSRGYEAGADLSGGQWQRIALARALYAIEGGARLLILDEPTANLDVRAEAALYDRFLELTRDVTTILISHRFSTVRLADRIAVIEHGCVVELGSHDELLAAGGRYAAMFNAQAAAYVDEIDLDAALEIAEPDPSEVG